LVETPEIEAKARAHFAERGLDDVLYFYGIHAKTAGLQTIHNYDVDHPGTDHNIGPHGVGIYVSFRAMWSAMLLMPEDHFFVVEHDVELAPDWKARYEQALLDVPADFDVLFIGSCCCTGKKSRHIQGEIHEVRYPFCNHACVIAKKALPVFMEKCRKCWAPIDIQLAFEAFPSLNVYTLLPSAAGQFNTVLTP
jgi:hypothetical protein